MKNNGYNDFFKKAKNNAGISQPSGKPHSTHSAPPSSSDSVEKRMKAIIAQRKAATRAQKKKSREFPASVFFGMAFIVGLLALALFTPQKIEDYLSKIEIQFLGQAVAAGNEAKPAEQKVQGQEKSAAAATEKTGPQSKDGNTSAEDISHFKKLVDRKRELDQRETELSDLEEELQQREREIEARIQHLEGVKREIASILKERVELDDAKVTKLVETYSNMKPKQAAEILGTVNEDLAVEVLGRMKKKSAAEIMNLLKADKAQALTEKLAGYRR